MSEEYTPLIVTPPKSSEQSNPKKASVDDSSPLTGGFITDREPTDNTPIELLERNLSQPFLVSKLDIGDFFNDNLDDSKWKVQVIDRWISEEMQERGFDMTVGSYNSVFSELLEGYRIDEHINVITRVNILFGILEIANERRRFNKISGEVSRTLPSLEELPMEVKKLLIYG